MKTNNYFLHIILTTLLCFAGTKTYAHDIEVKNSDGVTIYYVYTNNNTELAVSFRGSHYYDYESIYSGDIVIPESVTYNGITYSVTSIGESAFQDCSSLTSITIPNSVTSIGDYAFSGCSGLTSVTIPNSVTSIGYMAFYNCTGLTSVTIPNSVTSIGGYAFSGCSGLTSVTIPNSVTSIGYMAFYNCTGLTSVTIPNSVTSIGWYAFEDCTGLTSVTIGNSVTSIGEDAFRGCNSLTSIVVESGNTFYDSRDNCNAIIETATGTLILGCQTTIIPNSVTSIGLEAFEGCSGLTSVTIPNSVTSIGEEAFYGCSSLASVTIGNSVTSIGKDAFGNCTSLTSVTIGNSVTSIGKWAFFSCSGLTSVTIPNSVTSIGTEAFEDCTGLTSVIIGNSVTSMGECVFEGCNKLLTIISRMVNVCTIPENCFEQYVYNNATLYVPQGKTYKYKAIDYWTKFLTIEEGEPSGVSGDGPEKCVTPTITYSNGQLLFNTSTEGATCYYTITDNDVTNGCGNNISLCVTYNVKVYAWKSGYQNSDIATGTLCWIDTNPTTEGIINDVTQIPVRAVFVQANDGFVSISGLGDSERVAIYQTDGKQVATAKAYNGSASVATNISKGTPVIVKIGKKAVKVVMQ